jgi:PEP-CTERM motif
LHGVGAGGPMRKRSVSFGAVILLLVLAPAAAHAAPIILPAGSELILNWDFTGQVPAPPFDELEVNLAFDPVYRADTFTVTRYSDLNGTGTATPLELTVSGSGPGTLEVMIAFLAPGPLTDPFLDGIFSFGLRWQDNGQATPVPPGVTASAIGTKGQDVTGPIDGEIATTAVPEPSTLAVLSIGLIGHRWNRRRQKLLNPLS